MRTMNPNQEFQPTLLGTPVIFQGEGSGMITDENETEIYIESDFFTGWMLKAEYWELLGTDD
ncbi:MAG: hypothetical protein QOE26_888 [Verrucomicrobiota bacterium]|jgi:hypothetical protein